MVHSRLKLHLSPLFPLNVVLLFWSRSKVIYNKELLLPLHCYSQIQVIFFSVASNLKQFWKLLSDWNKGNILASLQLELKLHGVWFMKNRTFIAKSLNEAMTSFASKHIPSPHKTSCYVRDPSENSSKTLFFKCRFDFKTKCLV